MTHLLLALIIFLVVVVIHLLVARQSRRKGVNTGLFIFIASVGLMILWFFFDAVAFIHSEEFLKSTSTLMYLLLMPLYLRFYRSVNETSPASTIRAVLERDPNASYEDLLKAVKEKRFIEQALEALVRGGQVRQKEGLLSLSFRGKILAFFARFDHIFVKRSKGGR